MVLGKFVWGWGSKKGASQNFHIKRESLVKLSGCCKKGGYHKLTLTLSKVIFLSLFGVCVLYHFYQYFLCFNRKDLVLVLTESNQYMYDPFKWTTLNSEDIVDLFTNSKDIVNLYEVNLCIRQSFIHYNTGNCCGRIAAGANIYLYVCASILFLVCPACLSVCFISNKSTSENYL